MSKYFFCIFSVLADKENINYTSAGRFTATLPSTYSESMNKRYEGKII